MQYEDIDDIQSHHILGAQLWVGSSRNWSVFWEGLSTARQEKAPVRYPCCWLTALHGASRM